jgi:hypothetical protein
MIPKTSSRSRIKKGPWRSKAYLDWIREKPCLRCSYHHGVQAHHVRLGLRTMGVRKGDELAVPLCQVCHTGLHAGSEDLFWSIARFDPVEWCKTAHSHWIILDK